MVHTVPRKSWEERFVSDYTLLNYPDDTIMLRVPIGPLPEKMVAEDGPVKAARWFRPSRPVADAIVLTKEKIVMIEGKVFMVRDGIGALLTYAPLVHHTPELLQHAGKPVELVLVTARPPQWAIMAAEHTNVRIDVYQPAWIDEYYEHMQSYWTKERRAGRQHRKEVLQALGYDKPAGT